MRIGRGVGRKLILAFAGGIAFASQALAGTLTVVEHTSDRIRVSFALESYELRPVDIDGEAFVDIVTSSPITLDEPGKPALPRFATLLALPPDATARLRIVDIQRTTRSGITVVPLPESRIAPPAEPDGIPTPYEVPALSEDTYARAVPYPQDVVSLGRAGRVRNLRVVPLEVVPFQSIGGSSPSLDVITHVVVDVLIDRPASSRRRWTSVVESDRAEAFYAGILNYEQARAWRAREVTAVSSSLLRRSFGGGNPEAKIRVAFGDNEWVRVTWSALAARGWSETPAVGDLRLSSRSYDASQLPDGDPFVDAPVGLYLSDVDGNGTFDDGDWFAFYAQDAPTQRNWAEAQDRYTGENVYWLTWVTNGGTRMATRDAAPGDTLDVDARPTRYEYWEHVEENNHYYIQALSDDDTTNQRQAVDHLFMTDWFSIRIRDVPVAFEINDPAPGTRFGLRADWRAMFLESPVQTLSASIAVGAGGTGVALPGFPVGISLDSRYTYDSVGLTLDGYIGSGVHELITAQVTVDEAIVLNWFDFGYERLYRAHDGWLRFNNADATGRVRYTVDGFDPGPVLAFDMSDPDVPVSLTDGSLTSGTLVFEDDVADTRNYAAVAVSALRDLSDEIELDRPSALRDLTGPGIHADFLVVAYDDFADALAPWVARRAEQGHVVEVAQVSDVYDEFSGGVFSPEAIREYVRYAYRMRPTVGGTQPLFLMLVGDASEDYWGVVRRVLSDPNSPITSDPNYVPGYMVLGEASDRGRDPIILTDFWYIANPDGNDANNPYFSSMIVGRLPTGSAMETQNVVDKILTYEEGLTAEEGQEWRNRGILVADDLYSGAGAGGKGFGAYSLHPSEIDFVTASDAAVDSIRANGFHDLEIEKFYLSDYLDDIPELGREGGTVVFPDCGWSCSYTYARNCRDLDGELIETLNRGQLFATYQGHGNRNLISHEYVLIGNGGVGQDPWDECPSDGGTINDVEDRFANGDRVPVWFFYACHVAEMARRDEGLNHIGDSLGERLLLHRGGGSIATIASTGFEWLRSAKAVQWSTFSAWFGAGGRLADASTDNPYMLLGEIVLGAKNTLAAWGGASNEGMIESYVTLGDPTLRIDIAPPRLQVWQDQGTDPWDDPGEPEAIESGSVLRASDVDASTTYLAATLFDEAPIDSVWITIEPSGETPIAVAESAYELVAGDSTEIGGEFRVRAFVLRYDHPIEAADYDLVVHARDLNARERRFTLEARVDVTFSRVDAGGDVVPLPAGSLVRGDETLQIDVTSPIGLAASDVVLLLDGVPLSGPTDMLDTGRGGDRSFGWRLTRTIPIDVSRGTHTLALQWSNDGELRSESITVSTEAFRLDRFFAYPSPFADETAFFYRVTQPTQSATVKIYTVAGRLIRTLDQPFPGVDLNRIEWDGRDEDGDHVANGTYLYRLELVRPDGAPLVEQGKVARVLGHQVSGR